MPSIEIVSAMLEVAPAASPRISGTRTLCSSWRVALPTDTMCKSGPKDTVLVGVWTVAEVSAGGAASTFGVAKLSETIGATVTCAGPIGSLVLTSAMAAASVAASEALGSIGDVIGSSATSIVNASVSVAVSITEIAFALGIAT